MYLCDLGGLCLPLQPAPTEGPGVPCVVANASALDESTRPCGKNCTAADDRSHLGEGLLLVHGLHSRTHGAALSLPVATELRKHLRESKDKRVKAERLTFYSIV